jgi:hypothetical protein
VLDMARTQARARPRARSGSTGWTGALVFAGAAAVAILSLYLSHMVLSGYRFPVGPDGPVYTWVTGYAGVAGFQDAPGGGPGVPGLAVVLGDLLRTGALTTVTILGPVLATSCALAAAGLLESVFGPSLGRAAAAALLTGAFTAYLAGGWLANVAMVAVLLAALAALALAERSWRTTIGAAALLAAAALTHRFFFLIALAIVGLAIALHAPRALRSRRQGTGWWNIPDVRRVAAATAGAGVGLGLWAWISTGLHIPGDTSQDGFFRRLGLRDLLADRYRERLAGDAARAAVPAITGLGLAAAAVPELRREKGRFLFLVGVSWAVLTAGGIAGLALTGWGPPNRLLQFAFFVPVSAAVGAAVLAERGATGRALAGLATAVFVAVSIAGWFRQSPAFGEEQLVQARVAGRAAATLPPGTPLVFVVDTDERAAAYHVTQAWNVIRMAVPPGRIPDVRVVVGRPVDVLSGIVSRTGDREHDRIAEAYLREAASVLPSAAVFVLQSTNPEGYERASATGTPLGPGVVAVQSPPGTALPQSQSGVPVSGDAGVSPLAQILLCLAAVAALAALGGGWAYWATPGAGPRAVVGLAPSAGIAVSVLGTVGLDRFGVSPGELRGLAVVVILGALGYVAAVRAHRRERALTRT